MNHIEYKTPKHQGASNEFMDELVANFKSDYPELMDKYSSQIEDLHNFIFINIPKEPMLLGQALGRYVMKENNLKETHLLNSPFHKGIHGLHSILTSVTYKKSSSQIGEANTARLAYDLAQIKETIVSKIDTYKNPEKGITTVLDVDSFKTFMKSSGPMHLLESLYMTANAENLSQTEFKATRVVDALAYIPKQQLLDNFTSYAVEQLYDESFEEQEQSDSYEEMFNRIVVNKEIILDWDNVLTSANKQLSKIVSKNEIRTYCINTLKMVSFLPIRY